MKKMIKKPYILGIIPARKNSKRFPGKNIRLLLGRPLIDYIIKAALQSKYLDKLIVTSDCEKIRKEAVKSGACVPFSRPIELATDNSPTEEALRHAVLFMEKSLGHKVDVIAALQPTCPFTTAETIDSSIRLLLRERRDTVITVRLASKRAEWIGYINEKGVFKGIIAPEKYNKLAKMKEYVPSGNVYVLKRKVLFRQERIIGKNTGVIIISPKQAVDIDYLEDFLFAEFLLKWKN